MIRVLYAAGLVVVLTAGFLFAWFNDGSVPLDYLAGTTDVRIAFLAFGGIAIGCVIGLVGGIAVFLQQRREIAKWRERTRQLEAELESLRAAAARSVD